MLQQTKIFKREDLLSLSSNTNVQNIYFKGKLCRKSISPCWSMTVGTYVSTIDEGQEKKGQRGQMKGQKSTGRTALLKGVLMMCCEKRTL